MNEWIDGKADPPQPASKLPVLPPQSAENSGPAKRTSVVNQATAAPPPPAQPQTAAGIPFAQPVELPVTAQSVAAPASSPAPPRQPNAPDTTGVKRGAAYDTVVFDPLDGFASNDIQLGLGQFDLHTESELESNVKKKLGGLSSNSFFRGVPSWLASFVFHLTVIIVLALLTIAADKGANIEFILSDQPLAQDLDFMEVAVEIDSVTADDDKEKLLTDASDVQSELYKFDSSLDNSDSQLADQLEAVDALAPSQLEFERGDGKGASFFGTGALGSKFVFVVDCSGSMEDEYRWIMARRELKEAILGLTAKQDFYVFLYNDTSFAYTRRQAKLMPATDKNKAKIFKWLDKQNPIGDTRPWKAMRLSLRMKPDAIFLLSDGELKDDTVPRLRRENREKQVGGVKIGKIPVHTVSLGSGIGSHTMRAIAEQNDGTFTHVNTW